MNYVTKELQPNDVFKIFEDISQIARPTGNPKNQAEIINFIAQTLNAHGITTQKDDAGNLYASRKAAAGYEHVPGILLQAHVDMVCAPNEDIFPLKLVVDDKYLHADGTSCGLDNGMGAALAMSLLINPPAKHGLLEAAFTLNEDTDCFGAINMKPGYVKSAYMISLDDESWGKICIGSAGAEAFTHTLPIKKEALKHKTFMEIKVEGLIGGHSGYSIHKGQANGIKICAEIFKALQADGCQLVAINGGMADNAIPQSCTMVIAADEFNEQKFNEVCAALKAKFSSTDPEMKITATPTCGYDSAMSADLADILLSCPNGAIKFHTMDDGSQEIQTSSNLASIATEGDKIVIKTLSRSSVKAELEQVVSDIQSNFKQYGDGVTSLNHSSALCWEPDWNSAFLATAKAVFKEQNGKEPEIYAPHCYMEGAYFVNIHGLLPIALGPQIDGAHTVEERVEIATVGKCRNLAVGIIEKICE